MRKSSNQTVIPGSSYAWFVLVLLTFIYISSFVDRLIIAVLGTNIRQALGLPFYIWVFLLNQRSRLFC